MFIMNNFGNNLEKISQGAPSSADGEKDVDRLQKMKEKSSPNISKGKEEEPSEDFSSLLLADNTQSATKLINNEEETLSNENIGLEGDEAEIEARFDIEKFEKNVKRLSQDALEESNKQDVTNLVLLDQLLSTGASDIAVKQQQEQMSLTSPDGSLLKTPSDLSPTLSLKIKQGGMNMFHDIQLEERLDFEAQVNNKEGKKARAVGVSSSHAKGQRTSSKMRHKDNSGSLAHMKATLDVSDGSKMMDKLTVEGKTNVQSANINLAKIDIGDKISVQSTRLSAGSLTSPLNGVEILQSKKTGALTLLHLQLNPVGLGTVEARIRKFRDGLHINLQAERQSSARALAQNQHLLTQVLEKTGFGRDTPIHVHIAENAGQMTSAISGNEQQNEIARQNQADFSQFPTQKGETSSHNEGGRDQSDPDQPKDNSPQITTYDISPKRSSRAYRTSHRLIV